jgi:hypothetical protein
VKDNYNDWQKYGARMALGIDLNDSWTLTPSVMAQTTKTNGTFGFDPLEGDLKVAHAKNEDPKTSSCRPRSRCRARSVVGT